MLKLSAKDIEKYLENNELKNVASVIACDYRDLLMHGVITKLIRDDERKYVKQGILLIGCGAAMAWFLPEIKFVILGTVGIAVGITNIISALKKAPRFPPGGPGQGTPIILFFVVSIRVVDILYSSLYTML